MLKIAVGSDKVNVAHVGDISNTRDASNRHNANNVDDLGSGVRIVGRDWLILAAMGPASNFIGWCPPRDAREQNNASFRSWNETPV